MKSAQKNRVFIPGFRSFRRLILGGRRTRIPVWREQLALSQSKQRLRHNQSAPGLRHGHTCACSQCAAYCRAQAYGQAAAHGSANRQAHGRAHKLREPWGLYYGFRLCARVFCMEFTKC